MTAFVTGTASNAADLFTKLKAFLQTNSTLVSAGENWTQAWAAPGSGSDRVLVGPGLAGSDQVYVGLATIDDVTNNRHSIMMRGMTGVNSPGVTIADHVNVSHAVGFYVDSNPMTYWFVASGRRFMGVVQCGAVFESFYAGLFLPYADPIVYPYPVFVGGTRGEIVSGEQDFRSVLDEHSCFADPSSGSGPFLGITSYPQAWMLDPSGVWTGVSNKRVSATIPTTAWASVAPKAYGDDNQRITRSQAGSGQFGWNLIRQFSREEFGGNYSLAPLTLVQAAPQNQTFGVLDGVYDVAGFNQAATNVISVGGQNHLVVQNCFRSTAVDFHAMKLG